jgi:hypothetical protein
VSRVTDVVEVVVTLDGKGTERRPEDTSTVFRAIRAIVQKNERVVVIRLGGGSKDSHRAMRDRGVEVKKGAACTGDLEILAS